MAQQVKNPPAKRRHNRQWFDSWAGKIPRKRKWQSTPVVSPRKFHGQRSLTGYRPWDGKESDTTQDTAHKDYMQSSKEWKPEVIKDMVKTAKYPYGEQKETREMKIMDVKNYNEICRGGRGSSH